jgi:hypothetical protein
MRRDVTGANSSNEPDVTGLFLRNSIIGRRIAYYPYIQRKHIMSKNGGRRKAMRLSILLLVAVFSTLLALGVSANFAFAASNPVQCYVQYRVTVNNQGDSTASRTVTVNESAKPTSQNGFIAITLALSSSKANFTYSRDVNSSSLPEVFPYLSGLANQSFSYQVHGVSISANLVNKGAVPVSFNSKSYDATNYQVSFSAMNSSSGKSLSASGSLVSMPSGLIYSVQLLINGTTSINVQLVSTNLPLTDSPSSANTLGVAMVGAGVFGAAALAAPTIFKRVKHGTSAKNNIPINADETKTQPENGDEKPSYWVD